MDVIDAKIQEVTYRIGIRVVSIVDIPIGVAGLVFRPVYLRGVLLNSKKCAASERTPGAQCRLTAETKCYDYDSSGEFRQINTHSVDNTSF